VKLLLLIVLLAGLVGLGFYQGWFHFDSQNSSSKTDITITVDKDKLTADEQKAREKVQDLAHQAQDKTSSNRK